MTTVATPRTYQNIKGKTPETDEPTHYDADGVSVEAGAQDLRQGIDANTIAQTDTTWREYEEAKEQRNRYSGNNPHLQTPYSSLETITLQALRRYGDMHPGTVDGEVMMMFVEFANLVLEDLRGHPYWDNPEIDYYFHPSDIRKVPDNIMVAGMLYHYSVQQQSNKIEAYGPMYFKMMNRILYYRKYGSGEIQMSPWDRSVKPTGTQSYDGSR